MADRRLKFWGWGYETERLTTDEVARLEAAYALRFGVSGFDVTPPPAGGKTSRCARHGSRRPPARDVVLDRATTTGCCTATASRSSTACAPSRATSPIRPTSSPSRATRTTSSRLLDWCDARGVAVDPLGRRLQRGRRRRGARATRRAALVTIDLKQLDRVLEIDRTSRARRASRRGVLRPGARGPAASRSGLTLRHFPQSFEFSTLGGWIATRSRRPLRHALHAHRRFRRSRCAWSRRPAWSESLPPARLGRRARARIGMFIGSEGIARHHHRGLDAAARRARASCAPPARALRRLLSRRPKRCVRIAQAHLYPANCRLLDADEALVNGAGDGTQSILVLAFESADRPDGWMRYAAGIEIVRAHGGEYDTGALRSRRRQRAGRGRASGATAFLRMPYNREVLTPRGIITETFETAITWERFPDFHAQVKAHDAKRRCGRSPAGRGWSPAASPTSIPTVQRPISPSIALGDKARAGRAVLGHQDRRFGSAQQPRRYHHSSSRGGPRPSPLVRPPASRSVRPGAASPPRSASIPTAC